MMEKIQVFKMFCWKSWFWIMSRKLKTSWTGCVWKLVCRFISKCVCLLLFKSQLPVLCFKLSFLRS